MTRDSCRCITSAMATVASLACLHAAWAAGSGESAPPAMAGSCPAVGVELDLWVVDDAQTDAAILKHARDEVLKIWSALDIRFVWVSSPDAQPLRGRRLVPIVIRHSLQQPPASRRDEPLGSVVLDAAGRPVGPIEVALNGVVKATSSGMYSGLRVDRLLPDVQRFVVGRALGRVIAHELGHWLLGPAHTRDGLMARALYPTALAVPSGMTLPHTWMAAGANRLIASSPVCIAAVDSTLARVQ